MTDLDLAVKRGVANIYPSEQALRALLESGKKISLYCGYDPTAPQLHLGHSATLFKLSDFQKLGHKVIFLIGDFTGMIGDPTDKSATRSKLTREQVLENAKTYEDQASKILDFDSSNRAQIRFNSEWSDKLTFREVIELASNFTVGQLIERDMFQKRLKEGKPISLHEFLYPLMQGYDSVAMGVDLEVGGSDQTFNMLSGRTLMKILKNKEKFVLTTLLLEDEMGRKMSKTEGNFVALNDPPEEMYTKVMAFPDSLIIKTFELCTRIAEQDLEQMEKELQTGTNPMLLKKKLAYTLVSLYHGQKNAKGARDRFEKVVQRGELPSKVHEVYLSDKKVKLIDLISKYTNAKSISQAVRLIRQGAVEYGGDKIADPNAIIQIDNQKVLRVGKKDFFKPIVND